jgi:hypothetical protein
VPADTTYVSCSGGDACGESGGLITWNQALLPAGQMAQVVLTVRVDHDLATGDQIVNDNYGVTSLQGSQAQGTPLAVDVLRSGYSFFLPLVVRNHTTGTAQQLPPPPAPAPTETPAGQETPVSPPEGEATPAGQETPPATETPEPGTSGQEKVTFTVFLPVVVR